jgi:hypothetical protein
VKSIGVLDKSGLLKELAVFLNDNLPSQDIIATVIDISSALINNVPLVAATMGMYYLSEYTDDKLWQLIALCAGTGVFDTCHRLGERRGAHGVGEGRLPLIHQEGFVQRGGLVLRMHRRLPGTERDTDWRVVGGLACALLVIEKISDVV